MSGLDELRPREVEVLKLLGTEMSLDEIATELKITKSTVKRHMDAMKISLRCGGRREILVARARGLGFNFEDTGN